MAEHSTHFTAGNRVGPYEILGQLSQDDTGTTYKTYQASLHRPVAIKILADQYASDPAVAARFRQEAPSIVGLHHPNLPQVYEAGEVDGLLYILMEYIEGETLQDHLQGTPLTLSNCAMVVAQLADVLGYLHRQGIVHGDLTPANILIPPTKDRLVLLGFGLATLLETTISKPTTTIGGAGPTAYMSPEVVLGQSPGAQSDQYALAVLTFEMLSGHRPFRTVTPDDLLVVPTAKDLPSLLPLNRMVTPALQLVVQRALAKKPAARYNSIEVFNAEFRAALNDDLRWPGFRTSPASLFPHSNTSLLDQPGSPGASISVPATKIVNRKHQFLVAGTIGIAILVVLLAYLGVGKATSNAQTASAPIIRPTALPAPTIVPIATTFGGLPIENGLKELQLTSVDKQALATSFGNITDVSNISFYTNLSEAASSTSYYKSGPVGWAARKLSATNDNRSTILLTNGGEKALVIINPVNDQLINSLNASVSLAASLKNTTTLVMLADNLDDTNPQVQKLIAPNGALPVSPTVGRSISPTSSHDIPTGYKPYSSISSVWQADVPVN